MSTNRLAAPALLLVAAGGLVVGLAIPAAAHEARTLINGKSIAVHSIPGNRLKLNAVTGKQVKESTLGAVPRATNATHFGGKSPGQFQGRVMWAQVDLSGSIVSQSGGIRVVEAATGEYQLAFPVSVADAAIEATLHNDVAEAGQSLGLVSVAVCGRKAALGEVACLTSDKNSVLVQTWSSGGSGEPQGFYISAML